MHAPTCVDVATEYNLIEGNFFISMLDFQASYSTLGVLELAQKCFN